MKKIILFTILLTTSLINAQNTLLQAEFWKNNPTVSSVQAEIKKGNSASESNTNNFDPTTLAINNNAPLETILYLIKQEGNSVHKLTHDGRIYLHWAAYRGNVELVKYLINNGADINLTDDKGAIPLVFAASSGQADPALYEVFFKAGNNPKQKFKNGATVLLLAIANDKDLKLVDFLKTKGLSIKDTDDLGNTAFNYAARNGDIKLLKDILKRGVKFDGRALVIASQGSRSHSNTLETYKYLVEDLKINPNSLGDEGENVLHNLVKKPKQEENIAYFLAKGTDVNQQDKELNTVLMNAMRGSIDVVNTFFSKVKDINTTNSKGMSALSFAVENGSAEMVQFLLAKGAKTDLVDKKGNNLAYYWVQSYKPATAKKEQNDDFQTKYDLLEKAGVNFSNSQKDGSSLYHLSTAKNDLALMMKLEKIGIDLNAKNEEGMTVLQKAALTATDDSILKYLVSKGAKTDIKTEFDETAYDLASENELLIKNKVSLDFLK